MKDENQRIDKWRRSFKRGGGWNDASKRKLQKKEAKVITHWLSELNFPRYDILEIGCGNGYMASLIIKYFIEHDVSFTYQLSDILEESIALSQKTLGDLSIHPHVSFDMIDVYKLDETESKNVVLSTGYVSAATYKGAVPNVARVLRHEGVLIADFINHLSPAVFLANPYNFFTQLGGHVRRGSPYHLGLFGIRRYFARHGLFLSRKRHLRFRMNPILTLLQKR